MEWIGSVYEEDDDDGDSCGSDDEDEDDESTSSDSSSELESDLPFQVLVSHVCKRWRYIAIETPTLWTSINFLEGPPFVKSQVWIDRSKQLPIDIEIDCPALDGDGIPHTFSIIDLSSALDIIIPHVHRWKKLDVSVCNYEYMYFVMERLSECKAAPQLELIDFCHYEDCDDSDHFKPPSLIQSFAPFNGNAPKLKHAAFWGVHILWSIPLLHNLVDIELAYHTMDVRPSWDDFSRMLKESPRLEALTLTLSGPAGSPTDWSQDPIQLPSLVELSLAYHTPEYISPLLRLLHMPNLKRLQLDFEDSDFTQFVHQLAIPPFEKSSSLLAGIEYLKISGLPCSTRACDVMYEQLANLKSLHLNCSFVDVAFFEKLMSPPPPSTHSDVASPATQMYCPNLTTITTSGIRGKLMKDFVEARKAAGFPIKTVAMSESDKVREKDEKWLRRNVQSFEYFESSDTDDDPSEGWDHEGLSAALHLFHG